jgi:hypothetical protein
MSIETEIITKIVEVRRLQKLYFDIRSRNTLTEAKHEETQLDKMLEEYKIIQAMKK